MSKLPRNLLTPLLSPAQLWRHLHISWLTHPPVTRGHCSQGKCFNTSDVSQSPGKLVARSIRRTSSSLLLNINEIFREVLTATQTIVILILWSWSWSCLYAKFCDISHYFYCSNYNGPHQEGPSGTQPGGINRKFDIKTLI